MSSPFSLWRLNLAGNFVPAWLEDFATRERPQDALDDLLRHRADLGALEALEPETLLLDWLDLLANEGGFRAKLDAAVVAWVIENWGTLHLDEVDRKVRSRRWSSVLTVASVASGLSHTLAELLSRFDEAHEFLGALSQSPSADPLGTYLSILARHQTNRSLAPLWWRMCDLPAEVPYFHAIYALAGLRGLPPESEEQSGGFRRDVAQGLLRLAEAFDRLARLDILSKEFAAQEFLRVGRITLAAYPFPQRWREELSLELDPTSPTAELLERLLPGVSESPALSVIEARSPSPSEDEEWPDRAKELAGRLRRSLKSSRESALTLLQEQRHFAQAGGDRDFLVRSLCNFADRVLDQDGRQALEWASEARFWDPQNPYAWTTSAQALVAVNRVAAAEALYRDTIERFPQVVVARNGLAEVLKMQERLEEAEALYRDTKERFQQNVVARNGLAEVLKMQERLEEAEALYRDTKERFQQNVVAKTGLAFLLLERHELGEAQALFLQTLRQASDNAHARAGLEKVHEEMQRSTASWQLEAPPPLPPTEYEASPWVPQAAAWPRKPVDELVSEVREPVTPYDPGRPAALSEPLKREVVEHIITAATSARPRMPRGERVYRLQQARALRHLARVLPAESPEGERLRARATTLLEEVLEAVPYDLGGIAEKSFLLLELQRTVEANVLVESALAAQPRAPDLLALRAYIGRDLLHGKSSAQAKKILLPLETLGRLYEWASPMIETIAIRCLLALQDGQDEALARLGPLYRSVHEKVLEEREKAQRKGLKDRPMSLEGWIADALSNSLFSGLGADHLHSGNSLPQIRANLDHHRLRLNELEEQSIFRLRALSEPVLPISF